METMVRWSSSLRGQEQNKKDLQTGAWLPLGYKGNVLFRKPRVQKRFFGLFGGRHRDWMKKLKKVVDKQETM